MRISHALTLPEDTLTSGTKSDHLDDDDDNDDDDDDVDEKKNQFPISNEATV